MKEELQQNARIDYTMLGVEDHGILSTHIGFEAEHFHIGMGGSAFDSWDKDKNKRVEKTGAFAEYVKAILSTLEVDRWEELKGKLVRIELDHPNIGGTVIGIGHIIKDQWFYPEEFFKAYIKE